MKMCNKLVSVVALLAASMNVNAGWMLDNDASSVHFISVKKEQIAEVHQFKQLAGKIDEKGMMVVDIDLTSVETGIPIRNQRMQEMLFEVSQFKTAIIKSDLSELLRKNVVTGKAVQFTATQKATLTLHGKVKAIDVELLVSYDGVGSLSASVTKPIVVQAKDFDLGDGVMALQKVAGLSGITLAVPVNANLVFSQ
ncbi:YceI family protein [Alteromonas sp. a30]|uniref:YceI family protein n=1 Tax=Alteromonas sp. a30 TaxID=2730917 RepID=UPI002282009F|nr:YceI family protein [Alteromonas sp. a30]MCY7295654.1 YceI family protein [Alteromonas sp. a30]